MHANDDDAEQPGEGSEPGVAPCFSSSSFGIDLKKFAYASSFDDQSPSSNPVVTSLRKKPNTMSARSQQTRRMSIEAGQLSAQRRSTSVLRKRKSPPSDETADSPSPSAKRKSTTKERSARDPYSPKNLLVDSLRHDLTLVFIGLNPGLTTAATGHAYAHRSNLFWKILHQSYITPIRHEPRDTRDLLDLYSIGNTNLCARPTRAGDGLSKEEQAEGAVIVEEKIREFKPEAVCIVGKGIWEILWKVKTGKKLTNETFSWGWQDEDMWLGRQVDEASNVVWQGARTFVATSTSGLAASLRPAEKLAIWGPLGQWISEKRDEVA